MSFYEWDPHVSYVLVLLVHVIPKRVPVFRTLFVPEVEGIRSR